jgi:hypothetical protein
MPYQLVVHQMDANPKPFWKLLEQQQMLPEPNKESNYSTEEDSAKQKTKKPLADEVF